MSCERNEHQNLCAVAACECECHPVTDRARVARVAMGNMTRTAMCHIIKPPRDDGAPGDELDAWLPLPIALSLLLNRGWVIKVLYYDDEVLQ